MSKNRLAGVGLKDRSPTDWEAVIEECVPPRVQADLYAIVWWDWGVPGDEAWSNFKFDHVRNTGDVDWTVRREELIEGLELAGYENPSLRVVLDDKRSDDIMRGLEKNPSKLVDRRDWK